MSLQALADEINVLLRAETRSLFRHLGEAKPYLTPKTHPVWRDVQRMVKTSAEHARRLSALLDQFDVLPRPVRYSPDVAHYHYMKVQTLLPLLLEEKRRQVAAYEQAATRAEVDRPCVSEELGALLAENRGDLERLEEAQRALGNGADA